MIDDLYDLIGGRQTVWAATESFYRRVVADESVSHFFKSADMAHLRAGQSMFISMLLGGRVVYTGKDEHEGQLVATRLKAFLASKQFRQPLRCKLCKFTN